MRVSILGNGVAGKQHEQIWQSLGCKTRTFGPGQEPDKSDILSIATPDNLHINAILEVGGRTPIFCEKPLSHDAAALREWNDGGGGAPIGVHLPLVFHPPFLELKQAIPTFGKIYLWEAEYNYGRRHKIETGWRSEPWYDIMCGGGIHMVHLLLWLGCPFNDKTWPFPFGNRWAKQYMGYGTDGSLIRVSANFGHEGDHQHVVSIWGDKGTARITNEGEIDKVPAFADFLDRIKNNKPTNFNEALRANRLCLVNP